MSEPAVLVADDDAVAREVVATILRKGGYRVRVAAHGGEAWEALNSPNPPAIAVIDWVMPGIDGPEICRRLRTAESRPPTYVILLTSRDTTADIVAGLAAGADDYVTKPAREDELLARVSVGVRVVKLQQAYADRVKNLEEALSNVKQLQGLLPICSYCKSIRDDQNYWRRVETYISEHAGVQFSHSFCPDCYERYVKPQIEDLETRQHENG
jgi:sigma-B regulation protein RsbU (phosphoserine phosphatase)